MRERLFLETCGLPTPDSPYRRLRSVAAPFIGSVTALSRRTKQYEDQLTPTLDFSMIAVRRAVRDLKTDSPRNAQSRLKAIALAVIAALVIAEPAKGQLMYDYTSLLHGFASGPNIWSTHYPDIQNTSPGYLSGQVNLRAVLTPNLDSSARYTGQVSNLAAVLRAGGRHVLPAHSLGTLVARGTYIDLADTRPNVSGIIAIAALHQGAPLADNFISLRNFLGDLQRRLEGGQRAIRAEAPIVAFVSMVVGAFQGLGLALMMWIIATASGEIVDLSSFRAFGSYAALADLSPNSAAVQNLRSNTGDAAIPRANIYGTIPHKHAALRLLQSAKNDDAGFPALVERRNQAMTAFKTCRAVGYATIVYWGAGRHCGFARRVLGRLDERWVLYVNGKNPNGSIRYVPFDGVVPNERSQYPTANGLAYEARVDGVNHLNIYKTRLGLNQVAAGMLGIGMERAAGNPPPPPPDPPPCEPVPPQLQCEY